MKSDKAAPGKELRVLAIHDLSGHSHTSLMAVIPILQSLGLSVTALPTAVLSSNTEQPGFRQFDLTGQMEAFTRHWMKLGLRFDAIYSGFLSSEQQADIVIRTIERFRQNQPLVVVDPVMADNGKLYPCFRKGIIPAMRKLAALAGLITPNLTEAALLLGEPCQPKPTASLVRDWCFRLAELGPGLVVITSVPLGTGGQRTSAACFDRDRQAFRRISCPCLPGDFPGRGDIFTSLLTGLLLQGADFFTAARRTVNFLTKAIEITIANGSPVADGICLERALHLLPRP